MVYADSLDLFGLPAILAIHLAQDANVKSAQAVPVWQRKQSICLVLACFLARVDSIG